MSALRLAFIIFLLSIFSSVAASLRKETIEVRAKSGVYEFVVEVAEKAQDRARGLMERTDLQPNGGMLFIFPYSVEQNFWMKNTPTSLDIIFIGSDYKIKSIAKNTKPYSENIIQSGVPAQYVLEILAGKTSELGIEVGDRIIRIP